MTRPLGVSLVAIMMGVATLILLALTIASGHPLALVIGTLGELYAGALTVGLWKGKLTAYKHIKVVLITASVLSLLLVFVPGHRRGPLGNVARAVWMGLLFAYFSQPGVRAYFEREAATSTAPVTPE
jgi:hypothetical protein